MSRVPFVNLWIDKIVFNAVRHYFHSLVSENSRRSLLMLQQGYTIDLQIE